MSGYNEDAYRQARDAAIGLPCPFERAILSQCVNCRKARRVLLAEREAITCSEQPANESCLSFHKALHASARFALHMDPNQPWPFGKEIRVQCGGVLGLHESLGHGQDTPADVAMLVADALDRFGGMERLPYSEIMRAVAHYQPRKRRS